MKLKLLSIFLLFGLKSIAQDQSSFINEIKKNSLYFELLGNGVAYSINYDRIIPISDQLKLAPRVGFEFLPRKNEYDQKYGKISIPLELNLLWRKQKESKNFVEAGLGLSLFSLIKGYNLNQFNERTDTQYQMAKITTIRLGYRHQKPQGGLMYRAGILARLTQDDFSRSRVGDDLFFVLWPGFSIGYAF